MLLTEQQLKELINSILTELGGRGNTKLGSGLGLFFKGKKSLKPDGSATIQGDSFIVYGVKFQSEPATGAGNTAVALYNSAQDAGQTGKKWETTPAGRAWISSNIYDTAKAGSGEKYGPRLGTSNESYWSSWFFSVCYKAFKSEGGWGSSHFDYGADEGIKRRKKVFRNPDKYKGKILFLTFAPNEAPVYKGDAVFAHRKGGSSGFAGIAKGASAHMRIFGDDNGTVYGGNESNKVGRGKVRLSGKRQVSGNYSGKPYAAVYKRVRVIGSVAASNDNPDDNQGK